MSGNTPAIPPHRPASIGSVWRAPVAHGVERQAAVDPFGDRGRLARRYHAVAVADHEMADLRDRRRPGSGGTASGADRDRRCRRAISFGAFLGHHARGTSHRRCHRHRSGRSSPGRSRAPRARSAARRAGSAACDPNRLKAMTCACLPGLRRRSSFGVPRRSAVSRVLLVRAPACRTILALDRDRRWPRRTTASASIGAGVDIAERQELLEPGDGGLGLVRTGCTRCRG